MRIESNGPGGVRSDAMAQPDIEASLLNISNNLVPPPTPRGIADDDAPSVLSGASSPAQEPQPNPHVNEKQDIDQLAREIYEEIMRSIDAQRGRNGDPYL